MNGGWQRRRRTRLWVLLLLLPALGARLLVPPGFMPGSSADNAPTMQMCHGAGALPQRGDAPAPDERDRGSDGAADHSTCVFAATATAAPPPPAIPLLDSTGAPEARPDHPAPTVVQATRHPPYSPRAPPPDVALA